MVIRKANIRTTFSASPQNKGRERWDLIAILLMCMAIMQLVGHLEKHYSIVVPTEEIDPANFESINALAAFIDKQRG